MQKQMYLNLRFNSTLWQSRRPLDYETVLKERANKVFTKTHTQKIMRGITPLKVKQNKKHKTKQIGIEDIKYGVIWQETL